jgi:hypothetical protein
MLHACVEKFDVMGGRENILGWNGEVNKASISFAPSGFRLVRLPRYSSTAISTPVPKQAEP